MAGQCPGWGMSKCMLGRMSSQTPFISEMHLGWTFHVRPMLYRFPPETRRARREIEVFHQAHARANLSGPHVQVKGALAVFVGQAMASFGSCARSNCSHTCALARSQHGGCGVRTKREACEKCRAAWKRTRLGLALCLGQVRRHGSPHLQKGLKLTCPPRLKGIEASGQINSHASSHASG